jgi:hypothetical protein
VSKKCEEAHEFLRTFFASSAKQAKTDIFLALFRGVAPKKAKIGLPDRIAKPGWLDNIKTERQGYVYP